MLLVLWQRWVQQNYLNVWINMIAVIVEIANIILSMSDEKLKREIENLNVGTNGDAFKRAGKMKALKEEVENRRG